MRFNQLDKRIPRVPADKTNKHVHTLYVAGGYGWSVRVKWPGKHTDSDGDFVVEVLSENVWDDYRQFKHSDVFVDVRDKAAHNDTVVNDIWVPNLLGVAQGTQAPAKLYPFESDLPGVHLDALTNAFLALTVCEYRRYPQGDMRGGGRYLPINYTIAMLQGHWTPDEAAKQMRVGFPALRKLDDFVPFTHADDPERYVADYHRPAVSNLAGQAVAGDGQ